MYFQPHYRVLKFIMSQKQVEQNISRRRVFSVASAGPWWGSLTLLHSECIFHCSETCSYCSLGYKHTQCQSEFIAGGFSGGPESERLDDVQMLWLQHQSKLLTYVSSWDYNC